MRHCGDSAAVSASCAFHGWPRVQGREHRSFRAPLAVFESTLALSGATWYTGGVITTWWGGLFFATFRATHLHRVPFDDAGAERMAAQERLLEGAYGRPRVAGVPHRA